MHTLTPSSDQREGSRSPRQLRRSDAEGSRCVFSVAPATAHRWWQRYRRAARGTATGSSLLDRSSCSRTGASPDWGPRARRAILARGAETGHLAAGRLAGIVAGAPARRSGRSSDRTWPLTAWPSMNARASRADAMSGRGQGALLHIDVDELPLAAPASQAIGSRAIAPRRATTRNRARPTTNLHCVVDDHSRPAPTSSCTRPRTAETAGASYWSGQSTSSPRTRAGGRPRRS